MKIKVSIELDGRDQFTSKESSWGQDVFKKVEHTFEADDETDQHEAIANGLTRLLNSLSLPRRFLVLAHIVAHYDADANGKYGGEDDFVDAASKIIKFWKEVDDELSEGRIHQLGD